MDKNKEIAKYQKELDALKKRINDIKNKHATIILGFVVLAIFAIYFLDEKVYSYFGGADQFITIVIIIFFLLCFFYMLRSYLIIKKLEKQMKVIKNKLYNLMKLEI